LTWSLARHLRHNFIMAGPAEKSQPLHGSAWLKMNHHGIDAIASGQRFERRPQSLIFLGQFVRSPCAHINGEQKEQKEATVFGLLTSSFVMGFCESRRHSLHRMLWVSGNASSGRAALKLLPPGFPREDPGEPHPMPERPIPTDVPMPEPMDVPVPEPRDVPVSEPGRIPPGALPRPDEKNPKPRNVP
jgi:hypothetical protein